MSRFLFPLLFVALFAAPFFWARPPFTTPNALRASLRASLLPLPETPTPKPQPTAKPVAAKPVAAKPVAAKPVAATPTGAANPVSTIPTVPAPAPQSQLIRVGLCTQGGVVALWSRLPLLITDPSQPGRALNVAPQEKITFALGAPSRVAVPGKANQFWNGTLQIRAGAASSGAWQSALVVPAAIDDNEFLRLTTNGDNPRWGRPYRGAMEISPQVKPFDATRYKGALRVVNVVEMEEYLKGVVPWEMNPSAPLEALKAQAICARSNLLAKMNGGKFAPYGFDVTDYDNCQGYPGAANEKPASTLAVEQTRGLVLYYKGRIADAVYGTNSGGLTASDEDVWKGAPTPYLRGVRDFSPKAHASMAAVVKPRMSEDDWASFCAQNLPAYAQPDSAAQRQLASRRATSRHAAQLFQASDLPEFYRWSRFVSPQDLAKAISAQSALKTKMDRATEIRVAERSPSGRIKKLLVSGVIVEKVVSGQRSAVSGQPLLGGNPALATDNRPLATDNRPLTTESRPPTIATPAPPKERPVVVLLQGDAQIRSMLSGRMGSTTALPSSLFVALPQSDQNGALEGWIFKGAGWGHGVGMCQRGAQNHAREGWDARRILQFYFTGIEVKPL